MEYDLAVIMDKNLDSSFPISINDRDEIMRRISDLIHKRLKPIVSKKSWQKAVAPIHEAEIPDLLFSLMSRGNYLVTPNKLLSAIDKNWKRQLP